MGEKLQSVTDTKDGYSQGHHARVRDRGVLVVHGTGASGKDEPDGMMGLDLGYRSTAGKNYGEDILFPHPARDQLGGFAAEVEDDDRGSIHVLVCQNWTNAASRATWKKSLAT